MDKIKGLQEENKRLKAENARLRNLRCVNEGKLYCLDIFGWHSIDHVSIRHRPKFVKVNLTLPNLIIDWLCMSNCNVVNWDARCIYSLIFNILQFQYLKISLSFISQICIKLKTSQQLYLKMSRQYSTK